MIVGKIEGTGAYAPIHTMDNNDLARLVDTNDRWIRERTGIVRRHIAKEETAASMAARAAEEALRDAGMEAEELDLILVATISSEVVLPCAACEVQRLIGASKATCFDLNAACTGFLFAYNTAQAYIQAGVYQTVLVVGTDCLSRLVDWSDRGTCILFGDGAGAAVLRACRGEGFFTVTHSAGEGGEALTCKTGAQMKMDGQAVFTFALRRVPSAVEEVLEKNALTTREVDYFLLHQANRRIVEAVAKRLKEPPEKFPMNLQEYGNTSSASIPILLDELKKTGELRKGQLLVMAGFGAGLSWGATLVRW